MAAEPSKESFLRLLERSGLVPEDQLPDLLNDLKQSEPSTDSSRELADSLVQRKILTRWQADHLLTGRHRGFFLGPYRILQPLGKGGMATVFLAEHQMLHRRCAVKVLPAQRQNDGTSLLERFYCEARAVAALDHPNIVRAYDVNKSAQGKTTIHYLVMEYVEGQDLQHLVQDEGVLEYRRAADFIRQAAEGLAHAHQAGMVHRDVKPANLLVDKSGVVKLLDLGLARFFSDPAAQASLSDEHGESVLGTADYLAPEQAIDSHQVDARADIYSLGHTLYFLLTGHPPFPKGTIAQRLLAHQRKSPEPITESRPDVPHDLVDIIDKMTAKKPEHRYQTAPEVVEVLNEWLSAGSGSGSSRMAMLAEAARRSRERKSPQPQASTSSGDDTDIQLAPLDDGKPTEPPAEEAPAPTVKERRPADKPRPESKSQASTPKAVAKTKVDIPVAEQLDELAAKPDPLASLTDSDLLADDTLVDGSSGDPLASSEVEAGADTILRPPEKRGNNDTLLHSPVFWVAVAASIVALSGIVLAVVLSGPSSADVAVAPRPTIPSPASSAPPTPPRQPSPEQPPQPAPVTPPAPVDPAPKTPNDGQQQPSPDDGREPTSPPTSDTSGKEGDEPSSAEQTMPTDSSASTPEENLAPPAAEPSTTASEPPEPVLTEAERLALLGGITKIQIHPELPDIPEKARVQKRIDYLAERTFVQRLKLEQVKGGAVMRMKLLGQQGKEDGKPVIAVVLAAEVRCPHDKSSPVAVWQHATEIRKIPTVAFQRNPNLVYQTLVGMATECFMEFGKAFDQARDETQQSEPAEEAKKP